MPAKQRVYKVDVNDLVSDLALYKVTGSDDKANVITDFCKMYSIPLDKERIAETVEQYTEISDAIKLVEDIAKKSKK